MRYDYVYDNVGRLIEKRASGRPLLSYEYNKDNQLSARTYFTGKRTEYKYNEIGLLEEVIDNGVSQSVYDYTPEGRIFDNEIPRSGEEWDEYLKEKYGIDNVHRNINSVEDILSDPTRLKGYTVDELQKILGSDWEKGVYGSNGGGWKLMNGDISIFYHSGGGIHGGSYYGISSGSTGKIKVVDPATYIPLIGDKATIIYD